MQGNIVGGQWEQFTPCGNTLYATVFPPVANNGRMQVYWDTTPATNVTWAFQGDAVTANIPGYKQQSSGNFYLCTTAAGVGGTSAAPYVFVNLGAFDYGTPTGCADGVSTFDLTSPKLETDGYILDRQLLQCCYADPLIWFQATLHCTMYAPVENAHPRKRMPRFHRPCPRVSRRSVCWSADSSVCHCQTHNMLMLEVVCKIPRRDATGMICARSSSLLCSVNPRGGISRRARIIGPKDASV
jgi:hypothetical protein